MLKSSPTTANPTVSALSTTIRKICPQRTGKNSAVFRATAEMTAAIINEEGGEAVPFYGDCSDWAVAENMIKTAVEKWGRIDIIVNNAAGMGTGDVETMTKETFDMMLSSRNQGAIALMHYALPYMKEQKYGRIFNVASDRMARSCQ